MCQPFQGWHFPVHILLQKKYLYYYNNFQGFLARFVLNGIKRKLDFILARLKRKAFIAL